MLYNIHSCDYFIKYVKGTIFLGPQFFILLLIIIIAFLLYVIFSLRENKIKIIIKNSPTKERKDRKIE